MPPSTPRITQATPAAKTEFEMIPARQGERARGRADTSQARAIGFDPKRSLPDYAAEVRKAREA